MGIQVRDLHKTLPRQKELAEAEAGRLFARVSANPAVTINQSS